MAVQRRGQGGGSPGQELKHFTDREDVQAVFWTHVDRPSGSNLPVLMYYGVGGMGKTWLLKKLCAGLVERPTVPAALIDFEPESGGARYQRDGAALLEEIWRQFGVECPRFEMAFSMMRFKQGAIDKPLACYGGKVSTAWDLFALGGEAVLSTVVPGSNVIAWVGRKLVGVAASKLEGTPLVNWLHSQTGNEDYLRLQRMTAQEIYPLLGQRLGEDLDEQLPAREGKACRAVVFLDTFEALRVGAFGDAQQHQAEKPIRELYRDLTCVLIVIAGRDLLTWDEVDRDWADPASLEQHLLGGLSRHDASAFLAKCGIVPGPLQDALLRVSIDEDSPDGDAYYPFSLGLCADTVVAERHRGVEPDPATFDMAPNDYDKLAQRFLKSLHDKHTELWITSLAQTPRFDEAAARQSFSPAAGKPQDAAWENLLDYSFVQKTTEPGWFRLHSRMSAAVRKRLALDRDKFSGSHAEWRNYWKSRAVSDLDDHAALAWFHDFVLDPNKAGQSWTDRADRAYKAAKMAVHHDLLDWWSPTEIEVSPPRNPAEAAALSAIGWQLNQATLGNPTINQYRSIACYESALRISTEKDMPIVWASTQNNLGLAYAALPTGDRTMNLRKAIGCYEAALRVRTVAVDPVAWASTLNNLAIVYAGLPTGDRTANILKAIAYYEASLRVQSDPDFWATRQNNLGVAYRELPTGDRTANLLKAIACYEAALQFYTEAEWPFLWAMVQNNLGEAYRVLPTGVDGAHLLKAIAGYRAALDVWTEDAHPINWATAQNNMGCAYLEMPTGNIEANIRQAIECFEGALRVRMEADLPIFWATTLLNLGNAYLKLPAGDRDANLRQAIACYEATLRVRTEADLPADWAGTQSNLGAAYSELPTGARHANLRSAIACYESALRVYTEDSYPERWAIVRSGLDRAIAELGELGSPDD